MDLKQVFEERRSVNFFKQDQKIEDGILRNIIDLAVLAPSAFNLQPWEIVAVKSRKAKDKLFSLSSSQPKIKEAPVTLIIAGDMEGYSAENPEWKVLEKITGNKEAVINYMEYAQKLYGSTYERRLKFAESNASLLAMSIMYTAKYFGVDSHPISGIDFDGIRRAFDLDENKTVVMLISLGYFDKFKQLYPRRARKGYSDIVREV